MNNSLYDSNQVENLINQYLSAGGEMIQIEEGVLGHGFIILYDDGTNKLLQIVIKETYLNEWSSAHKIRRYKILPKKYLKLLEGRI